MAKFTVRVELHDVDQNSEADYEKLHTAMESVGFSRTIVSGDIEVRLPRAEYRIDSPLGIKELTELVKSQAKKTGYEFGILVTKSAAMKLDFSSKKAANQSIVSKKPADS